MVIHMVTVAVTVEVGVVKECFIGMIIVAVLIQHIIITVDQMDMDNKIITIIINIMVNNSSSNNIHNITVINTMKINMKVLCINIIEIYD
uniref:Uncharacterized protein n=1 Tax=Panagrolaimus sp. ES5 TaxID=591445 RepID=A0AC34FW02_9BILA